MSRAALVIGMLSAPLSARSLVAQRTTPSLPSFQSPMWVSPHEFDAIGSVLELRDGQVLVADLQTPAVQLLSKDGRLVRTIGAKGAGPGEYTEPRSILAHAGDSIVVVDRGQRRVIVLTPSVVISRTMLLPEIMQASANDLRSDGRGALFFLKSAFLRDSVPQANVPLRRWRFGQAAADSLAALRPPAMKRTVTKDKNGREMSFSARLVDFSPQDDWAVAPDGAIAIIRAVPYRVEWLLPSGQRVTGPIQPSVNVPVAPSERDPYLGDLVPKTKPAFAA
ncbi:MAG: 6-bladed beta-propeller, partial [Gemmatimonadaceae bacterium]|nr:6-bladed beta-propeller [Gemmatimonadaceae bacterium]